MLILKAYVQSKAKKNWINANILATRLLKEICYGLLWKLFYLGKIDLRSAEWNYTDGFHSHAFKNETEIIHNQTKNLRDRRILIWKQFCLCRYVIHGFTQIYAIEYEGSSVGTTLSTVMSSPTRAFLKPLIFYPDSCEQGLKPPLETGNLGDRIYWFRVDGRPIRVKKSPRSQKYPDSRVWT